MLWLVRSTGFDRFLQNPTSRGDCRQPSIADQPGRLQTAEHRLHVKHIFLTFTWMFSSIKCNFQNVNYQSNWFTMSYHVVFCQTLSKKSHEFPILPPTTQLHYLFIPIFPRKTVIISFYVDSVILLLEFILYSDIGIIFCIQNLQFSSK